MTQGFSYPFRKPGETWWHLVVLWVLVGRVSGICVWQGGGGFRLACGFKQSGLLRMRSLGGLKGWAGAGFTIGDEDGFKDSLTNKESKPRGSYPNHRPGQGQQYGQYSHGAPNQGQQFAPYSHSGRNQGQQHESENLQKRSSLWNSWKWPSVIKKNGGMRGRGPPPQRMGPIHTTYPYNYAHAPPMYSYPPRVPLATYRQPVVPLPHYALPSAPHPQYQQHPSQMMQFQVPQRQPEVKEFKKLPEEIPGLSLIPELESILKETSDETESQIESVLQALRLRAQKQKKKEAKAKKPYGLQLLENSVNFGTKFQISETSVPSADEEAAESSAAAVTGYDTNLFPDIYFTSTTPKDRLKKILDTNPGTESENMIAQESTTEAILRKLRLKKIKLLKKGHKLKLPKPSKAPKEQTEETTKVEQPTSTNVMATTTRLTTSPAMTTRLTTSPATTTSTTTVRTTTTLQTTTTEKPKPPVIRRTIPTSRPDYGDSSYYSAEIEKRPSDNRESWTKFSPSPHPTSRTYPPIAENPLIRSGKWKDIYDPRFSPEHKINRGKLELLAAALTTTSSQRPAAYRHFDEEADYLPLPQKYYREEHPIPEYPPRESYPNRFDSRYRDEGNDVVGLPSQIRIEGRDRDGQFVKFDSRESLNLVNRTKSYNDAFYSHFNKTAIEIADSQPHPTPFHYFSAYNQNTSPNKVIPPKPPSSDWWGDQSSSAGHFSRSEYTPSSTMVPRAIPRPVDQWAGMGRNQGSSVEEFRPRLDHSTETGDLLRKKSMTFFATNRDHGVWDRPIEGDHPNFVTDDNFQGHKYHSYSTEVKRNTEPRPSPPTLPTPRPDLPPEFYYSSQPSFSEWKNYVGSMGGVSSTTIGVPPPTLPSLIEPTSNPTSRPHPPDAQPKLPKRKENDNEAQILSPIKVTESKKVSKVKPEHKKSKAKTKQKEGITTTTTVKTTTTAKPVKTAKSTTTPKPTTTAKPTTTTKPIRVVEVTTVSPKLSNKVTEPASSDDDYEEYSDEDSEPKHEVKGQTKHPKKPAAAAFLPVSGLSEMSREPQPAPPVRLEPPQPLPPQPALGFDTVPLQKLGPPPPPPDFATSHLNEFSSPVGMSHQMNIQTDWNLHPLLPMASASPPPPEPTVAEVTLQTPHHHLTPPQPPTIHPQFQQRHSPMSPQNFHRGPPPWNRKGLHHNVPPPFYSPTYPHLRPFSQQYPAPPGQGYPKPIRHMIPGRSPMGLEPPNNFPPHRGPSPYPPHEMPHLSPPMGMNLGYDSPPHFSLLPSNRPQVHLIQENLIPPPAPPPQILIRTTKLPMLTSTMSTPTTSTSTTTTKSQPVIVKEEKVDERDLIMKALQTLTRAKSDMLHSVVNEKYGQDVAGIVKVVPTQPITTTTLRPTTTTPTTTTTLTTPRSTTSPTTTVPTRIVFNEIPEKFVPLVNYVKKLKVPTYENDNVQIDYFNFKSNEEPKIPTNRPLPAILGLSNEDLAFLASNNQPVQVPPLTDAKKFEEMLRFALASKIASSTPPPPTVSTHSPLVNTLTQMGIIQKLQERNVTSSQIETLKKLIQLNKFQEQVNPPTTPAPPTPPPTVNLIDNFRHILNHLPSQQKILEHRISQADPSIPVNQHLTVPPSPTTPKPYNSFPAFHGPTLQALKAIALNRIQTVQPAPLINLPQQTAPEDESADEQDQITVDLSPLLGLADLKKPTDIGVKLVKVRNAPKSYYPGDRLLPFDDGKEIFTNFQCQKQEFFPGLYGDESNSCKVFHLCAKTNSGFLTKTFRCPQGTVFDQEVLRCNWSLYVTCKGVEAKYLFNKYLSQSFQFLKSLGEFSASIQSNNGTSMTPFG